MRKLIGVAAAAGLLVASHAHASDAPTPSASPQAGGTMKLFGGAGPEWGRKLSDAEMADLRGGVFERSFSAFFGIFDTVNATFGAVASSVELLPTSQTPTGVVESFAAVGVGLPTGGNGAIQVTSVVGDHNFVFQGIVINVNLFNGADISSLTNLNNVMSSTQGLQ